MMKSLYVHNIGRFVAPWLLAFSASTLSQPAMAQAEHRRSPTHPQWRGDISRFHEHDLDLWRGGRWTQGRHDGRLGWWWVIGNAWYFYPVPVYPYPNPWEPPPAMLQAPQLPPPQYWYFCDAAQAYYPYASTCPGGWKQVPAKPGDMPDQSK